MSAENDKSIRLVLHSCLSFVRSVEQNRSSQALTLDHLLEEHLRSLRSGEVREVLDARGESVGRRLSKLDALDSLERGLTQAIQALRGRKSTKQSTGSMA